MHPPEGSVGEVKTYQLHQGNVGLRTDPLALRECRIVN